VKEQICNVAMWVCYGAVYEGSYVGTAPNTGYKGTVGLRYATVIRRIASVE